MEIPETLESRDNLEISVILSQIGFYISLLSVIALTFGLLYMNPRNDSLAYLGFATIWAVSVSSLILIIAGIIDIVLAVKKHIQVKSIIFNILNLVLIIIYFGFDYGYLFFRGNIGC